MTSMLSKYERLTETRATDPGAIKRAAGARTKAPLVPADGRLMIIACDHPARGANGVGDRPLAMADRADLLDRLQTALSRPGVDGLLGSPDIIEDLLLLGALEGKVVFGSMNRGGLQGAVFELDDAFTGYDAQAIADFGFNGGKTLTRVALDDPGTRNTLTGTANAVNELAARGLAAMVEPFWSSRVDGRARNDLSPDAVIKSIGVASALGRTTAHTWLKLPVVPQMDRVMDATTLPTLLLGGDPDTSPEETFTSWQAALALPAVRGLVVGRTLLYPGDDDVAAAVDLGALNETVGPDATIVQAAGSMPGDLQMLWRAEDPKQYHVEYAFSCMGYEIAGALGIKMAAPEREVYSLVGDGSYLMMAQEIVTAVSENIKLIVILVQNHGFASIGALSDSLGSQRFGTNYRFRDDESGQLDGDILPIDLAANAASLGADVIRVTGIEEFRKALDVARQATRTTVVHIDTDPLAPVPSSESWWDVPVSQVSELDSTRQAYRSYQQRKAIQRPFIKPVSEETQS